jgi:hypothetical protein
MERSFSGVLSSVLFGEFGGCLIFLPVNRF